MTIQEHPPEKQDPDRDQVSPKTELSSTTSRWATRVGLVVSTYPLPTGTILLLLVSLGLWLAG